MKEIFCFLFSLSPFFSITLAEGLVILGALWTGYRLLRGEKIKPPVFFWALALFAVFSFLSALFSLDRGISLRDTRELFLYLIPLVVVSCAPGALKKGVILGAGLASFLGIVREVFVRQERLTGFVGHYMTEGGLMMMALIFTLGVLLFEDFRWEYLASAFFILVALLLTLTRSAWVGAVVGALFLLYRKKKLLAGLFIPAVLMVFLISPAKIKERALSIFSLSNPTNVERINMWRVGLKMAKLRPLLGIGQNMASRVYPSYRIKGQPPEEIPHLHNTYLQITVERGLLGILSFLAFVFLALRELWRRKGMALALPALAVVLGFLTSGFFEYNFGDSEVKIAFLIIVSLPFAYNKEVLNDKNSQEA